MLISHHLAAPRRTGSAPVQAEDKRSELGEVLKFCAYTIDTEYLENALGSCLVDSVVFEGSDPVPPMLTAVKGWDEIGVQEDVAPTDGELAWPWNTEKLNCEEAGCLDGETIQIRLFRSERWAFRLSGELPLHAGASPILLEQGALASRALGDE